MFLKPFSSFSLSSMQRDGLSIPCLISKRSSSFSCNYGFNSSPEKMKKFLVSVSNSNTVPPLMEGFLFLPFEEVKKGDLHIPEDPQLSLGRQYYSDECEIALNEQINVEYGVSYVYHAMFAYFDRDNIALRGLAKFFKESSGEEREHAEKLIRYQNIRGGKVKLHSIMKPPSDYEHEDKGDALFAMELALSLEKLTNEKLLKLHSVAQRNCDPQLEDFIEKEYLEEQVEAIKKISEFVAQLRRVGKGHGVWHFDQMLLHEEGNAP